MRKRVFSQLSSCLISTSPRRRKKRAKKPAPVTHKLELQALAIRTGKIYLQVLPDLLRQPVELFLDIEGIPDQQAFYLIGLLVCEADSCTYHSFWADTLQDETHIWQQFLEMVDKYPDAPIYHYGSYEPRALAQLSRRYESDAEALKTRLVNVNTYIYGKVYFPIHSNRLKDIGEFIGASWTAEDASGLQSLVWRHRWEETQNTEYQQLLLTYNEEDCRALMLLTNELTRIKTSADTLSDVDFADQPKRQATEIGEHIHSQFEEILKFAHANYDKKKIRFRQDQKTEDKDQKMQKKPGSKTDYQGQRQIRPRPTKVIQIPHDNVCHIHEKQPLSAVKKNSRRLVIDLVLTRSGIKKTIIEYLGIHGYCPQCKRSHAPRGLSKYSVNQLYGHNLKAFIIYQRLVLRLPYKSISRVIEDLFGEQVPSKSFGTYIREFGNYYSGTEEILIRGLFESPFIHADETSINIRGSNQYVWVFTDGQYVIFRLTETREATVVHDFLAEYNGILISDFYPGYDSVDCRQQKCWVHLIRDINNDLWGAPFDSEYETFVLQVRNMILPIMEAVQKHGLKKRNLNKFRKQVDRFYRDVIIDKNYQSELVLKYQKRFIRYKESLFTFLEQNGIPWHNNTAERAIRHLAKQRVISGSFFESVTHSYLILLGIMQSCRFQSKSFFKFLFSGETNLDNFKATKSRRNKSK